MELSSRLSSLSRNFRHPAKLSGCGVSIVFQSSATSEFLAIPYPKMRIDPVRQNLLQQVHTAQNRTRRTDQMKIQGTMLMFVLAGCMCAAAQTSTSDSMNKSDAMKSDNMHSDKKMDKSMGKQKSMTGCVSEQDGKYMLMTKDHPNGVMLMSSEDLKPHVGHKVKVKGAMMSSSQMSSENSMNSGSSGSSMSGSGSSSMSDDKMKSNDKMKSGNGMGMMGVQVTEMKMVSDKCSMPKM
jgi:hypothetical protein